MWFFVNLSLFILNKTQSSNVTVPPLSFPVFTINWTNFWLPKPVSDWLDMFPLDFTALNMKEYFQLDIHERNDVWLNVIGNAFG